MAKTYSYSRDGSKGSPSTSVDGERMRAAVTRMYGPQVLTTSVVPATKPSADDLSPTEVLVRVSVVALSSSSKRQRPSTLLGPHQLSQPTVLGTDFSGTVDALPRARRALPEFVKVGARVFGRADAEHTGGACAEYLIVDFSRIAPVPDSLSLTDAACLPTVACTTYAALASLANIQPGDAVLVLSAACAEGVVTAQLANALGAKRVAIACSSSKAKWLGKFLRAQPTVQSFTTDDLSVDDILKQVRPDVVVDCKPAESNWDSVQSQCSNESRYVAMRSTGAGWMVSAMEDSSDAHGSQSSPSGARTQENALIGAGEEVGRMALQSARLLFRRAAGYARLRPAFLTVAHSHIDHVSLADDVAPLVSRGSVRSRIERTISFDQIEAAHELVDSGKVRGHIAVVVSAHAGK